MQLIKEKKMTEAGFEKIEAAKREGMWQKAYTSKIKLAVPNNLRMALQKKPIAYENFKNFATTYQNMYIGWVTNAKTEGTRKKRIEIVVENSLKNKRTSYL